MSFFADTAIDAVQDAKNTFIKTFVTDEAVQKPLQSFVEAQRTFAKQIAKTTLDIGTAFYDASQKFAYPTAK
jgi:hypothetical protein